MRNTLEVRYWNNTDSHGIKVFHNGTTALEVVGCGRDRREATLASLTAARSVRLLRWKMLQVFGNPDKWSQTPGIDPLWDATWYRAAGELEIIQHLLQQVESDTWQRIVKRA